MKKNLKENYSTLITTSIIFLLLNLIFRLPMELMYKAVLSILLLLVVNRLVIVIETITGEIGQRTINKFVLWILFTFILWCSSTLQN
jgi:hypothetical protein